MAGKWCRPSRAWIGWTAGIIDGEGSVCAVLKKRHQGRYYWESYCVRITVSNTDIQMMEKLKELWGGSYRAVKRNRIQWRTCYHYCITGLQGLNFLYHVMPYLITKKKQAEIAYNLQKRISDGVGRLGFSRRWRTVNSKERQVRDGMYVNIKLLNRHEEVKNGEMV